MPDGVENGISFFIKSRQMKEKLTILSLIALLAFSLPVKGQNEDPALLLFQGKAKEVISRLEPEMSSGTLNENSMLVLARAYMSENLYQKALLVLDEVKDEHKSLPLKGESFAAIGNLPSAVDMYERLVKIEPNNTNAKASLGRLYLQLDQDVKARNLFEYLVTRDSTNLYYRRQYALACYRTDQTAEAIVNYNWIVAHYPGDLSSLLNLVNIQHRLDLDLLALQLLKTGLEHFPGNIQLMKKAGELNFLTQNYQEAARYYHDVLPVDSSYVVKKYYGISLFFDRKEEQALKLLQSCYKEVQSDDMVAFYIGLCLKRKADYKQSAHFLETAIKLATPTYMADFYHHLADVYGRDRRFKESITCYQKVLEYDSTRSQVLFDMATTYEEFNNNKTIALGYYQEYLKRMGDSDNPNIDYALKRIRKIKEDLFMDQ